MKRNPLLRRLTERGFTLIELMLVMVILTVLAAIVVPRFTNRSKQAKVTAAKADIASLEVALDAFEIDTSRYPTTSEGMGLLMENSGSLTGWNGPYLKRSVVNDPWGNPYVYTCPGEHNTQGYDLHSYGPDGQDATEDDIDNWTTP